MAGEWAESQSSWLRGPLCLRAVTGLLVGTVRVGVSGCRALGNPGAVMDRAGAQGVLELVLVSRWVC